MLIKNNDLKQALESAWESISTNCVHKIFGSMKWRDGQVMKNNAIYVADIKCFEHYKLASLTDFFSVITAEGTFLPHVMVVVMMEMKG